MKIEALTAVDMIRHQILPAASAYATTLCDAIVSKEAVGATCKAEHALVTKLSAATDALYDCCEKLVADLENAPEDVAEAATYYHEIILADMAAARKEADLLESLTDKSYWPYPTYSDLLFY